MKSKIFVTSLNVVAEEFQKRGFDVKFKGGQAGYDLEVNGKRVEVRTSEVKKEWAFPDSVRAWGWKLRTRDKEKRPNPIKYDYIVLLKLEDDWSKYTLFMLSKEDVESMGERYFGGYRTVAIGIYLFKTPLSEAIKFDSNRGNYKTGNVKDSLITPKCIELNKNPTKFLIDWKKFR